MSKYINVHFVAVGNLCVCIIDVKQIINDLPALVKFENKEETYVRLDNKTVLKHQQKILFYWKRFWARTRETKPELQGSGPNLPTVGPDRLT